MSYSHFEETNKYIRENNSNAVLSVDSEGLSAYKKKKYQQKLFNKTVDDVQNLKQDMADIKSMLSEILHANKDS